jgi:hypothetical protein
VEAPAHVLNVEVLVEVVGLGAAVSPRRTRLKRHKLNLKGNLKAVYRVSVASA